MLYGLVILVHVVACLLLIAVILLQAGRGGGLSETFGADEAITFNSGKRESVDMSKTNESVPSASQSITTLAIFVPGADAKPI